MDEHVKKLKNICRICGKRLQPGDIYKAENFEKELAINYGIFLALEDPNIFPSVICRFDSRDLYRCRSENSTDLKEVITPEFVDHGTNCRICNGGDLRVRKGRPTKRKFSVSMNRLSSTDDIAKTSSQDIPHFDHVDQEDVTTQSFKESFNMETEDDMNEMPAEKLLRYVVMLLNSMETDEKKSFFLQMFTLLSEGNMCLLFNTLGNFIYQDIKVDGNSYFSMYKNISVMANLDVYRWLQCRNGYLISFFLGIANFKEPVENLQQSEKILLAICRATEQTYMLCHPLLISPLSFLLNVTSYAVTGSKTVVDMIGTCNPAGHYKAVTQWLKDQGTTEPTTPDSDVMNIFDNEQVIGRKHSIRPKNKVNISIITNKGYVKLNSTGVQKVSSFKPPSIFLHAELGEDSGLKAIVADMIEETSQKYSDYFKLHYEQLFNFVNSAIDIVMNEQQTSDGSVGEIPMLTDKIDDQITKSAIDESTVTCDKCGTVNNKRKIVCEGCKQREGLKTAKDQKKKNASSEISKNEKSKEESIVKLMFSDKDDDITEVTHASLYDHVASNHEGSHEIVITDPVYCNPNSLETLCRVLRKIGIDNGISRYGGSKKHWTFICCDGLPYLIIRKLVQEAVICTEPNCGMHFISKNKFLVHIQERHNTETGRFVHEFDWFYLRIGGGHYEMNLFRSFFELNWTPFLEDLCMKMGFVSEAAKQYAKGCKDTHKTWNLLLIFHIACLRELVLPYVRQCLNEGRSPNAKEFFSTQERLYNSTDSPNVQYLMDQVCRFSQGIINFRIAVRRNNAELLKSAKFMTKELFHGRHHPRYQMIEVLDTLQDTTMPEEVRKLNDAYASITTTGNPSTGEDFDFVLEEKNRQLKSWIPKGLPTDLIWQTVCRNNTALEAIKEKSMELFNITADKGSPRPLDIGESVDAFRCVIRKSHYLQKNTYHTSISGTALDEDLVNFIKNASKKRNAFLLREFLKIPASDDTEYSRHPFPITPAERAKLESIERMTVSEIKGEIEKLLELIDDPLQHDYHFNLYKNELKGKKKVEYISFLEQLRETLTVPANSTDSHDADVAE